MSVTDVIKESIQSNSNMNLLIKDLIDEHTPRHKIQKALYNEYKGEVAILKRVLPDPSKLNRMLNHDFRAFIVDQSVGYMFGKPVTYSLDPGHYNTEEEYLASNAVMQHYNNINNVSELDSETGKYAGICGYAGRLHYIDTDGEERACLVPPWECIFVDNQMVSEVQLAVRYFDVYVRTRNKVQARTKVELYDKTHVAIYLQDEAGYYSLQERIPHMFKEIPLI